MCRVNVLEVRKLIWLELDGFVTSVEGAKWSGSGLRWFMVEGAEMFGKCGLCGVGDEEEYISGLVAEQNIEDYFMVRLERSKLAG